MMARFSLSLIVCIFAFFIYSCRSDPGACNGAQQPIYFNSTWITATWNGHVLASSNETIVTENNYYFPPTSINAGYLVDSNTTYTCPWKGFAIYYHVEWWVNGTRENDALWSYVDPCPAAELIRNYASFDKSKVNITATTLVH